MLTLEEARAHVLEKTQPLGVESIPLSGASSRILAESISAPIVLPPFDNSAMDGYAVRSADVVTATVEQPVELRLGGRVAAGDCFTGEVQPRTCVRVFTGSPLPAGTDAVVMQEDTRTSEVEPDRVKVLDSVKPWENVRFAGEDVKSGDQLFVAGEALTANRLCLLAALGISTVKVGRKPVVSVLATGSELCEAGQPLAPGQIYESNRTGLAILLVQSGAIPHVHPVVTDTLDATRTALERAFVESDAIITSGGVSVGEFDFVKRAFTDLGGQLDFWRVAIKPGKPFVFGRWGGKYLFGVPGNPVASFVSFLLLVRPAILRMQGAQDIEPPSHPATLAEPLSNHGNRLHFVRVTVDAEGRARSAGTQASNMLRSLAAANGLIAVLPNTSLAAGAAVRVLRW
jgi:molybdopterin molybdotransferase